MKQQSIDEVLAADRALIKAWELLDKAGKRESIYPKSKDFFDQATKAKLNIADAREQISATVQEPFDSLG